MDSRRMNLIEALGETSGQPAFVRVLEWMNNSPEGKASPLCCNCRTITLIYMRRKEGNSILQLRRMGENKVCDGLQLKRFIYVNNDPTYVFNPITGGFQNCS